MLAYLGRRLDGRPLLLVVSWRSEAVPPGHRLRRLAADLSRAAARRDRAPGASTRTRWRARARPCPAGRAPELERRVYIESEGLPLFVAEYLAALGAGGRRGQALDARRECATCCGARLGARRAMARQVLGRPP